MNFTKKASITVTGTASPAEIETAVLDTVQRGAEAGGSASGLTLVSRNAVFGDDGSATVELVYEKVEATPAADAGQGTPAPDQPITFNTQVG